MFVVKHRKKTLKNFVFVFIFFFFLKPKASKNYNFFSLRFLGIQTVILSFFYPTLSVQIGGVYQRRLLSLFSPILFYIFFLCCLFFFDRDVSLGLTQSNFNPKQKQSCLSIFKEEFYSERNRNEKERMR